MQAAEAIQLLILSMDQRHKDLGEPQEDVEQDDREREKLAIAVSQAMLNSMVPVARFRAFVEIDVEQPKRSAHQRDVAVYHEFTISGLTMGAIRSGLIGLGAVPTNCRVLVFEQRATGADVLCGFQGQTKTQKFRNFLKELDGYEAPSTVVN